MWLFVAGFLPNGGSSGAALKFLYFPCFGLVFLLFTTVVTVFGCCPNSFFGGSLMYLEARKHPFRASKIDVFSWLGPSCAAFHNGMLDFGGLSKIVVGRFPNVFGGTLALS